MSKVETQHDRQVQKQFVEHKKKLKNITQSQQKQIDSLKLEKKKKEENENFEHVNRLRELREKNENEVFNQVERTDKVLTGLQEKVDVTKKMADSELKAINTKYGEELIKKEQKYIVKNNETNNRYDSHVRDKHTKFEENLKKFNTDSAIKERQVIIDQKFQVAQTRREHQQDYEKMKSGFDKVRGDREVKFQKALFKQREVQVAQLEKEHNSHLTKLEIHKNRYKGEMEKVMKDQKVKKQSVQKEFENDYNTILADHKKLVASLESRTKGLIHEGKNILANEKSALSSKAGDVFYSANKLYPTYKDLGDSYDIMIKVPKHEKNSVNIMTKERKIRISLDRRFDETLEDNQFTNVSKKVETITSSFDVPDILDSKAKVSKAYTNGVLIFNVKKS